VFPRFDALAVAVTIWAAADGVPTFNVEPLCLDIARRSAPVGDKQVCLRKEREAREQLQREWARFHPGDRVHCLRRSSLGGEPTYTALLTCLELEREARNLRGRQEQGTTGEAR
jgi:hypothetical protein